MVSLRAPRCVDVLFLQGLSERCPALQVEVRRSSACGSKFTGFRNSGHMAKQFLELSKSHLILPGIEGMCLRHSLDMPALITGILLYAGHTRPGSAVELGLRRGGSVH